MKKRSIFVILATLVVGMMFVVSGALATDVPDTIKMESKVYPKHKKTIVDFSHKKHAADYGIACTDCHHVYTDGKNVYKEGDAVAKCETCHPDPAKPKKPQDGELTQEQKMGSHYWVIHENCKGCHKSGKKGPTKCTECHLKPAE